MLRRDLLKASPLVLASTVGHVALAQSTAEPHAAEAIYDVRKFGATGDGKTVDSPAINKAIEAVAAAGGGMLVFPAGTYLCFSIHLKSHVDLYLNADARSLRRIRRSRERRPDTTAARMMQPSRTIRGRRTRTTGITTGTTRCCGRRTSTTSASMARADLRQGTVVRIRRDARRLYDVQGRAGGRGEQGDCAEELPQRDPARLFDSEGRALCAAGDGRGQHDTRQSADRYGS